MILNDTQINKATISFLSKLVCISVGQDGVGYVLVTKAPKSQWLKKKNKALYLAHAACPLQVSWELCPTSPSLWEPGWWERHYLEYCWLLLAERKEWRTLGWLLKNLLRDFLDGSVVKTACSRSMGPGCLGSIPGQGTRSHMLQRKIPHVATKTSAAKLICLKICSHVTGQSRLRNHP